MPVIESRLSTSSDDSGIAIGDAASDHDLEDETDSCEVRLTGRHILHSRELRDSLQEAAVCTRLGVKLERWQDVEGGKNYSQPYFGDAQMRIAMGSGQTISSRKTPV